LEPPNVPEPALDRLSRDRADELADDAAADRARENRAFDQPLLTDLDL
jgi:hypothetical protein